MMDKCKFISIWLVAAALILPFFPASGCTKTHHDEGIKYHCPMHPTYISDKPGDCPICGMRLVPIEKTKGMNLVPVKDEAAPAATSTVEGHSTVSLSPEKIRLAGIQTAEAKVESLDSKIRASGIVTADETLVRHVHTKTAGWVEKLFINFTGQLVRKGEPILSIYSPELLASQEEYLRSLEASRKFQASTLPDVKQGGMELVAASKKRLELFDVPAGFIERLEKTGKPQRDVTLLAPSSGYITSKQIYEGQQVAPEQELFTVTDLSKVWIEADFYEYEARLVKVNEKAVFTTPYYPGKELTGKVAFIFPYMNTQARTLKVRFDFANKDMMLKPGMFVNVGMDTGGKKGVTIPDSAVLDTGVRQIVYVDSGNGVFEPRIVKVGMRGGGRALILSGLTAGERVVVKGNFLVDSESRIKAAVSAPSEHSSHGGGSPE